MPRDCTDLNAQWMYSPSSQRIPYRLGTSRIAYMSIYNGSKTRYLEQLVSSRKLSEDGKNWLTLALDPFHDYEHIAAGFPDADGSQTIVSCYQYQADITKPVGLAGNWDCHIYNTPMMMSQAGNAGAENVSWTEIVGTAASFAMGPLMVCKGPAGTDFSPVSPVPADVSTQTMPSTSTTDLIAGINRIIGMGYEVTNTTATLNKQGSVTSYRMPQYISVPTTEFFTSVAGATGTLNVQKFRAPPGSVATANLLKGTRTWDAAAGVYATCVMNTAYNPMMMSNNCIPVMSPSAVPTVQTVGFGQPYVKAANVAPAVTSFTGSQNQLSPFDTTGAIFTGLSEETTLTLKFKVFVERAPTQNESSLVVLASPSAAIDHVALELYSHAISQLPVAVTVAENGLGDWFKGVVNVIRNVVNTGTTIAGVAKDFVPGLAPIYAGGRLLQGAMDSFARQKNTVSVVKQAVNNAMVKYQPKKKNDKPKRRTQVVKAK